MKTMETHEFQTETKQLLDLMIHSIYSNKNIFLRELVSNSSDALDKLRFASLTNNKIKADNLHIRIESDEKARTLTVSDNGVGMNRQEVIDYIGTIAKSGSQEFLKILQENKDKTLSPELIGQFGVGLYSCFMVADEITMVTRRFDEKEAIKWHSNGDGSYTIEEEKKDSIGTSITLHLKPEDSEDGLHDYTEQWKIREIIKKYSDYVAYPILMEIETKEIEKDENGMPKKDGKETVTRKDETLNSIKAIWIRPEKEVTDEEYTEFYKHISHDWQDPLERVSFKAEGVFEFRGLLYLPSVAPMNLFTRETIHGIQLYIKRVFIMSDCKELIPEYLRFVKGVVDSEDLSLNISREILQQNKQITVIRKKVVSKILEKLSDMKNNDTDKYLSFWKEFGKVLKEGLFQDVENRQKLLDLVLTNSSNSTDKLISLKDYVNKMKGGQDTIYYMSGKSLESIENSPHLESFKEKGYDVLFFTDAVDEIWLQSVLEYDGKPLKSIGKGTVDLGTDKEKEKAKKDREEKEKSYKSLLDFLTKKLDTHIKEVRLSSRLTSSPVCLVGEAADMTPQMEELLKNMGRDVPVVKRILEVNPKHPILEQLQKRFESNSDDPILTEYAELLYGQALLAEGSQPPDPSKFSKTITELMTRAL